MINNRLQKNFVDNCKTRGLSKHTIRAYNNDLTDFYKWMKQNAKTEEWNKDTLDQWKLSLVKRELAPTSIRRRFICLNLYSKWLEDYDEDFINPFHKFQLKIKIPQKLPKNLTHNEIKLLFSELSKRNKKPFTNNYHQTINLSIRLLLTTGIRIDELCSIKIEDINFSSQSITIHGKGNRERIVFIVGEEIQVILKGLINTNSRLSSDGHLFINSNGQKLSPDYFRYHLNKLCAESGIERRISPHMLRHTAATNFIEAGVDIRYVQKLLGHRSISTTEIYTHVSNTSLKKAINTAITSHQELFY